MPDGQEEREDLKARIEEMRKQNREDLLDPEDTGDWAPERVDS